MHSVSICDRHRKLQNFWIVNIFNGMINNITALFDEIITIRFQFVDEFVKDGFDIVLAILFFHLQLAD